jgi:hypothetical protein
MKKPFVAPVLTHQANLAELTLGRVITETDFTN